ncbi:LOW QUALITY PROTEIN: regulator of G-protein signaling 9-binding protein-like [Aegotheles albertisi]
MLEPLCPAALCQAMAGHRQLLLQLTGGTDSPWLREERRRSSAEARKLSTNKEGLLPQGLRQAPASPRERRELEQLWVLFLRPDLCRAHHLCQCFSAQGPARPRCTPGWGSGRGGPTQPPVTLCLEEEIKQVRAMLAEMERGDNSPLWMVEPAGMGSTAAGAAGEPCARHCCRVLEVGAGIREQGTGTSSGHSRS